MIDARRFLPLMGAAGAVVLLHQLADLAQLLPATDFATPAGRVRQLLAVEARSPGLLCADILIIWALTLRGLREGLRVAGVVHLIVALLLLVLLPVFLLDAGSLAGGFAGSEAAAFRVVVGRTLLLLALLGLGGLLAARSLTRAARSP